MLCILYRCFSSMSFIGITPPLGRRSESFNGFLSSTLSSRLARYAFSLGLRLYRAPDRGRLLLIVVLWALICYVSERSLGKRDFVNPMAAPPLVGVC
jgi:hypothetical protein